MFIEPRQGKGEDNFSIPKDNTGKLATAPTRIHPTMASPHNADRKSKLKSKLKPNPKAQPAIVAPTQNSRISHCHHFWKTIGGAMSASLNACSGAFERCRINRR